jgi:hypothetical protein
MAGIGHENPKIEVLKKGAERNDVLLALGQPRKTLRNAAGNNDFYSLEFDNQAHPGLAIAYILIDPLTFFIWEIPGTAIEGSRGYDVDYNLQYDVTDKLTGYSSKR